MNRKIKIMNKQQAISDEEIRSLMDFDGLVQQASHLTSLAKMLSNLKVITGSIVAVSVTAFLVWIGQHESTAPAEKPITSGQSTPQQVPSDQAIDSMIPLKVIPEQKLPSVEVRPKKIKRTVPEKKETMPAPTGPVVYLVYREAEPIEGFTNLYKYFDAELKYPELAQRDSLYGIVTVTFIVNSKGQIDKITVLNSPAPVFNAEAIRLIRNMPAWRPATIDGKPVPSKFSLPLNFRFKQ